MTSILSITLSLVAAGAPPEEPSETGAERLRVAIETDAPGGDPDDEASLVRFFLYLDAWDVEALIGTRSAAESRLGVSGKERILQYIDDYEEVWENLRKHKADYPSPDALRERTKQCYEGFEGRDFVTAVIDRDDPRPLWYLNWGTNEEDRKPTALREALDRAAAERTPEGYRAFAGKIHYVGSHTQDHLGEHCKALGFHMDTFFPNMDGGRWYHRWRPLTEKAGGFDIERDVKRGHGPLCANYTIQKEGDTPAFMHLIPNGLQDPDHPEWGGWSGRYSRNGELGLWWCDQRDTLEGRTHRDNTLIRWAAHIQMDFEARADWCVAPPDRANHEPAPVVDGDASRRLLERAAETGSTLRLSARGTTDPDGDALRYEWFVYREAGSYPGEAAIEGADGPDAALRVPADAAGKTIHIVLQVTDDGDPPLTRYRRVVVQAR